MRKIIMGRTGLEVSELCFGTLPIGPLQKNVAIEDAADIISYGLKAGINFIDTAQAYKTYPHICLAIKKSQKLPIISTKSSAKTYEDMCAAIEQALQELGVDKLDIFLLHAARVNNKVLEERKSPLKCLLDYREKGVINAVGISTHVVEVVNIAARNPEIDVVFPILNYLGMGILGGTRDEMENAINECHKNNKGVFMMKVLAGGNLVNNYITSMNYITSFSSGRFPIAIGMLNKSEVDMNISYLNNEDIPSAMVDSAVLNKRFVIMKGQCIKCKKCVEVCHSSAITVNDAPAEINEAKCLKCGYCVAECPQFAIRMN